MSNELEQVITDIHNMLIGHMSEEEAKPIIKEIRDLAYSAGYEGYAEGYNDKTAEVEESYIDA